MTKKHFIALADTMRIIKRQMHIDAKLSPHIEATEERRLKLAEQLYNEVLWNVISFCRGQNNQFDSTRFIEYIDRRETA